MSKGGWSQRRTKYEERKELQPWKSIISVQYQFKEMKR